MPNLRSAEKRVRSTRRKTAVNQTRRSTARTYVKRARRLIAAGELDEAQRVVQQAVSALDRAAVRGVIHPNKAARQKSRLMKLLHQAS